MHADSPSPANIAMLLDKVVRQDWGRLVAALIKTLREFQLAEDSLQDAIESAMTHWARNGLPRAPSAWLLQTARRKAIDRLRRNANFRRKEPEIAALIALDRETAMEPDVMPVPDERLSLIFTCCHPALDEKSRVALTLRTVAGLATGEIARAFLDSETTMAQRLVRAKQKIRLAGIPFKIPETHELPDRLDSVLSVIYLVFNEGFAATAGDSLTRQSLTEEAIRLARLVTQLRPDFSEASGLLALMLLGSARLSARTDPDGRYVPLDQQDRNLWNRKMIDEGALIVRRTLGPQTVGPYLLQAAISAIHGESADHQATDWPQIVLLYDELLKLTPNPVVRLNRTIALSFAGNPQQALADMQKLGPDLEHYQPFHAGHADMLRRSENARQAHQAYSRAIELSANPGERAFLALRRDNLQLL